MVLIDSKPDLNAKALHWYAVNKLETLHNPVPYILSKPNVFKSSLFKHKFQMNQARFILGEPVRETVLRPVFLAPLGCRYCG